MRTIKTSIEIQANAEKIWSVLTDFSRYAEWNPFILSLSGEARVGAKLVARIAPPDQRQVTFKPIVTVVEPARRLEWMGKLGISGLFDGRHCFRLIPIDDHTTLFEHSEDFSGLLVPLVLLMAEEATTQGFQLMNEALKRRVEA